MVIDHVARKMMKHIEHMYEASNSRSNVGISIKVKAISCVIVLAIHSKAWEL